MSTLLENLQMMNEAQFKMLSITVIVTVLTSCNSQHYYYKENDRKYDIYYGPTALDGFQKVKPPKDYEVSSELHGNKHGNCHNFDFRCIRPFPTSVTYIFECQVDYQCPGSYKCCQPRCFLHKVCQPSDNLPSTPLKYQTTEINTTPITIVTSTTTEPTTTTIYTTELLTTNITSKIETTTETSTTTEGEYPVFIITTGEISTTTETPLPTIVTITEDETTLTTTTTETPLPTIVTITEDGTTLTTTGITSSSAETTKESTTPYLTTAPESTNTATTTIEATTTEAPIIITFKYLLDKDNQKFVLIGGLNSNLMPKELPLFEKGCKEVMEVYPTNQPKVAPESTITTTYQYDYPIIITYPYYLNKDKDKYVLNCKTNSSLIPEELLLFEKAHEEEDSKEYPSSYVPKLTDTTDNGFKTDSPEEDKEDKPVTVTSIVHSSNIEENEKITTTSHKEITVNNTVITVTEINEEVQETVTEAPTVFSPITTKRIEETTIVNSKETEDAIIEHSGDKSIDDDDDDDDIEIVTDKPKIKTTIDGFYFSVTEVDVLESAREKEHEKDAEERENDKNVEAEKNHNDENEKEADKEVGVTEIVNNSVVKTTEAVIENKENNKEVVIPPPSQVLIDSGEGVKIRHEKHKNITDLQKEILENEGNKEKIDDFSQSNVDGYDNEDDTGSGVYDDDDDDDDEDDTGSESYNGDDNEDGPGGGDYTINT